MKRVVITCSVLLASTLLLYAVEMSTPIIKTDTETIAVTTSFTDLDGGSEYRVGIGTHAKTLGDVDLTLQKAGESLSLSPQNFTQGYTSTWFEVDELNVRGFVVRGAQAGGERITFRASMQKSEAERLGKFYIFVAKKYGPTTWYLEDGSEILRSHW